MIFCRRADQDDVALFKEIRLTALKDSPDAFGSTYDSALQRDQQSWQDQLWSTTTGKLRNTQFAFDGGECVGIAALYREPLAISGDIIMMWVKPAYRGSLVASLLVGNLITWARDSGFTEVSLIVTDTNARAIRFYNRMGFQDTGERTEVDLNRNLSGIRMVQKVSQ